MKFVPLTDVRAMISNPALQGTLRDKAAQLP